MWQVGHFAGANGTITVDGQGSKLTVKNLQTWIGIYGNATLSIRNGGQADFTGGFPVAENANSRGEVTVTGAGSLLKLSDLYGWGATFAVRDSAQGFLTVSGGGKVQCQNQLNFGGGTNARATTVIRDSGSLVTSPTMRTGAIDDSSASATTSILAGARYAASQTVSVTKNGLLIVDAAIPTDIQIGPTPLTSVPVDSAVHILPATPGKPSGLLNLAGGEVRVPAIQIYSSPVTGRAPGKMAGYGILRHPGSAPVQITNTGTVQTNGIDTFALAPPRTQELLITGNYTQSATGLLSVTLGPRHETSTGPYETPVEVTVTVNLDGDLRISPLNGFIPALGHEFSVVKAPVVQGRFAPVGIPTIDAEKYFRVKYGDVSQSRDVIAVVAPRASLLFRSNGESSLPWVFIDDGIPGWDHASLQLNDLAYESHPGYGLSSYYSHYGSPSTRTVPSYDGVQQVHSYGTFMHDSPSGTNTDVSSTLEIPISYSLGSAMAGFINGERGKSFAYIDSSNFSSLWASSNPLIQKGAANTYTCVGLLEKAAERSGLNGGEGFIPSDSESLHIDLPTGGSLDIPLLSPSLLAWYARHPPASPPAAPAFKQPSSFPAAVANTLPSGKVQGLAMLRQTDFILTDPLGRRFGSLAGGGLLNEIPSAFYSGAGELQQFVVEHPIPGQYHVELNGHGGSASAVIAGSTSGTVYDGSVWEGSLPDGQTRQLTVTVPGETYQQWSQRIFGTVLSQNGDADGDGSTNSQEFLAGTEPNISGSRLKVLSFAPAPGGGAYTLSWPTAEGRTYRVERSASLALGIWTTVQDNIPGTGANATFTAPNIAGFTQLFYRVALASP